jgi:hypothetical protein
MRVAIPVAVRPLLLASALVLSCSDGGKRIEERQKAIEESRAELKAQVEAKSTEKRPEEAPVKLDPFWDDPAFVTLRPDGACPEGLWALFPGPAPGEGPEKKANEAKRADYAAKLKGTTFVARLRPSSGLVLQPYDSPKGQFSLELFGLLDCVDAGGHIAIGWNKPKAITPPTSAAKDDADLVQRIWRGEPMFYPLPMKSQGEAKEWEAKHRFGLDARVILKLGKGEVDRKMVKVAKQSSGDISVGGGTEDWGAGRMVRAQLLGVRIAIEREKTALVEKKESPR